MKVLICAVSLIFIPFQAISQSFTKVNQSVINQFTGDLHSVVAVDFDNNYTLDIFVGNGSQGNNALFINRGDSSFQNASLNSMISQSYAGAFSNWADVDNDCDLDVIWPTTTGSSNYFLNDADGSFTKITIGQLASDNISAMASPFADYNNDGLVDVVMANRLSGASHLYKNNGNGQFTRIDTGAFAQNTGGLWTASWGDIENDGDPDLFLGNISGDNYLLINQGAGKFENDTASVITQEGSDTRTASWGDYNNDGYLDLFVGRINNTNFLYTNNGDGTFSKVTSGSIVTDALKNGGSAWADLDNDGDLDLYASHTGNGLASSNRNIIYRNNGNGSFSKLTSGAVYAETEGSIGCAVVDLNDDGYLDIINANRFSRPISVLLNDAGNNNFLKLRLYGSSANRMAIGARVEIISALGKQIRYVNDESRRSIQFETHFGLGQDTVIDSLRIYWPGGGNCLFTQVPVNAFFNIGQAGCALDSVPAAAYQDSSRYLNAYFQNKSKGAISSYHWEFGDGDTSNLANPSHIYSQPGRYQVTLRAYDNFCRHKVYRDSIEICPDTARLGFYSSPQGLHLSFTDTSKSNGYQFSWNFGDGNSDSGRSVSHHYSAAGNYQVCLSITDSCRSKQICQTITVCNDTLQAAFSHSVSGYSASFNDSSINANAISWDFGDGATANGANPLHVYSAPGIYFVCQTVQGFCTTATYCDTVEVCLDTAVADFNFTANNLLFNFNDLSQNANAWFWDFGDGDLSTQANPAHIYQSLGTYTVCLTVSNDCNSDTICKTITVCNLQAQAAFSYQGTASPFIIQFSDQSQDAVSYLWDFGDGSQSTKQNPLKAFSDPLLYNVCLRVTDSCGQEDSICQGVDLTPFGSAELRWINALEIYPNPASEALYINNPSADEQAMELKIYDLQGREISRRNFLPTPRQIVISTGQYPKGVYLLKISMAKSSKTFRIMIN